MCDTCGCTQPDDAVTIRKPEDAHIHEHTHADGHSHTHEHPHASGQDHTDPHAHDHSHDHDHTHDHSHPHTHDHEGRSIAVETDILQKNNLLAERNRGYFEAKNILALNLVSSPGSGKTSLLERTIRELSGRMAINVIEGDQQTMNDANRIQAAGAPVVQVNTGNGCHLDSDMVHRAVKQLQPADDSVLMIENVGNLVCPSLFDLGESQRVVIMSITEGEDKPLKYPNMFRSSQVCIINKMDLLPHLDFDLEKAKEYALQVNHHLQFIELSVKTGEGFDAWLQWLEQRTKK
ncbi:MAG: hydrogenase accessory protein HypB [Ignavibacteria bacterium]|nr:MAG: hydrogenase accessory protein HypB [Ignavibacteria bacterium]